ncbi:MAG: PatB family C-S lyase [Planctomycetaceae bacterium]|nr:PatB family C-S lyase [Planctomycetaceae bacterium]
MSAFDFDELPERRGTGSIKWERYPDYTPYWVADMDFVSPPCVVEALQNRVAQGVFGYAHPHDGLIESVLGYLERMHGAEVAKEDLIHLPGMVPALSIACRTFCEPGDAVMISSPVYYPFFDVASDAGAEVIDVPHIRDEVTWRFNWDAMEAAITPRMRVLILCNPQNPLGRAYTEDEIVQLAEFCAKHNLVLVSDEIHCDLILDPQQTHFSTLRLPVEFRQQLVTLQAPSKTYNIAGLGYSFAVIENPETRRKFTKAQGRTLPEINLLALVAAEAAYRDGEPWRQELITYLRGNRDVLAEFIQNEISELTIHEHAATYLYWIDCSRLDICVKPSRFFAEQAGIFLSDGTPFGGPQHVRFNFGCPRDHMLKGLHAMRDAVKRNSNHA